MPDAEAFFLGFILTILIIRTWLYFHPTPGPTILGVRIHHYAVGILTAGVGVCFQSLHLYAVGLALFADEITYLALDGRSHEDNYSAQSIAGTCVVVIAAFLFRTVLVLPVT